MLAIEFISWWYGKGWVTLAKRLMVNIQAMLRYFSVPLLAKTLFVPWKRIATYGSRTLQERLRALLDNLISRLVGFSVRFMVLCVAFIVSTLLALLSIVFMIAWPMLPVVIPVLVVKMFIP